MKSRDAGETVPLHRRQLSAIAQTHELFTRSGIDYWLFGGCAVDFHVGSITRSHDDIDVAIWLDDHDRIAGLFEADGWKHAPEADEDGGTGYERDAVRLELTFLASQPISGLPFSEVVVHASVQSGSATTPRSKLGRPLKRWWTRE